MRLTPELSEQAALGELGSRIEHARLNLNITQATVAELAGLSLKTIERIETGKDTLVSNLMRVLRALNMFDGLEQILPPVAPGPIEQVATRAKGRMRATGSRGSVTPALPGQPWVWGDLK